MNVRYGTSETATANNTTSQLANMLDTVNKVRKQITDENIVSGDQIWKKYGEWGVVLPAIQAKDDARHSGVGRTKFQTRTPSDRYTVCDNVTTKY